MDLFEDLKNKIQCNYISELPKLWRTHQNSFAFVVLTLDFNSYDIGQWIDLCNYLQIPFTQADISDLKRIRALFKRFA